MPPLTEASSIAALLLNKCTSTTSVCKARQLHALILTSIPATSKSPYVFNNILSMYARCRSIQDSHNLFDKMPDRNIVSFNALISAYSRHHHLAHWGFHLFAELQSESLRPNGLTFTSLLHACSGIKNRVLGSMIHSQCIKFGFLYDVCVQTSLLGMYSNCGVLDCAEKVFCSMHDKDCVAWNTLFFGYLENGKTMEGLQLFGTMLRTGVVPTNFTYTTLLSACSRIRDHLAGELTHSKVIVSGTALDLPLYNALLDMYSTCGDNVTALKIFRKIKKPDLVSWNSMISGYANNGDGEMAVNMFLQFRKSSVLTADEYTFAAVISAIGAFAAADYGKPLHGQVEKVGFGQSVYIASTLMSMYLCNGEVESAQKIFISVPDKDVVLWTEMIAGHCRIGNAANSIRFFHGMLREGHKADEFTLTSALSVCAEVATMRQGEMIHSLVVKTGYIAEMTVCGSLVDMYAKIGNLGAAEFTFSNVTMPNLKCWNSMLGAYGYHGKAEEAFSVFNDILQHGLKPDHVTFISLLAACSHGGLVDHGMFLWNYMKENGLEPSMKHYSCMITLLSRAGLLEEAENFIMESPLGDECLQLWKILLSSCVSKGNRIIGMRAAELVLGMAAEDSATNVLLSNFFASTDKWGGVSEIRRKIRGFKLEKDPGLSWLEVMNSTHVFSSSDYSHPQSDEIRAELHRLQGNLTQSEADQFMLDAEAVEVGCGLHLLESE
ncbi:pentatricopeptide repeat-containing protein At3g50420 [Lycium ferocissimum]|uniref:pentatricopeptide repeat-containing protein At3g50420 n=1 Tax=Lycium ferocissimum TaxID=112874 RepID=UPI0028166E29|nr:pentatricopeptide repeat-containing protein At3g50420 [Lycium ferocissimum]